MFNMKQAALLQLAVLFIFILMSITGKRLMIINESKFPYPVDTKFQLQLVPTNRMEKLVQFGDNTIVIIIIQNKENRRFFFDYGRENRLKNAFYNGLVTIEECAKNNDSTLIHISIRFSRISNGCFIQIFDLPARSYQAREAMMDNLTLATLLYNETIQLVFPPSKLEMSVNLISGESVVLMLGQLVTAKCRYNGSSEGDLPIFKDLQPFYVIKSSVSAEKDEYRILFKVQLSDHLRHLRCWTSREQKTMMIKVLHPTTSIIIEPTVNKTLEANSTISCYPKDGYPPALVQWNLIEGPPNASSFYEVKNTGRILQIKPSAPTEARWRFICSIKGEGMINKTISFTTKNKYCDKVCLNDQIKMTKNLQSKQNNNPSIENDKILKIIDQINKSMEMMKENSRNQMRTLQESISNITEKYDSISQRNKEEIYEIKSYLRYSIIGVPDLMWTIGKISAKMKSSGNLFKYFHTYMDVYRMCLNIIFLPDKIQIYLKLYKKDKSKAIYPHQLETTIVLINTANPQYYKVITKSFLIKSDASDSPYFIFENAELADVIKSNSITIKCLNKFK